MKTYEVVAGDLITENGTFVLITGEDKLRQDVLESLVSSRKENGYGAGLGDLIGLINKIIPTNLVFRIIDSLEFLVKCQKKQKDVLDSERITKIYSVQPIYGTSRTTIGVKVVLSTANSFARKSVCIFKRPNLKT